MPVNIDFRGLPLIKKAYESYGVTQMRPVMDEFGKAAKFLNVTVLPTTLVLDEAGVTRKRIVGQRTWNIDYINNIILDIKDEQKQEHARKIENFQIQTEQNR